VTSPIVFKASGARAWKTLASGVFLILLGGYTLSKNTLLPSLFFLAFGALVVPLALRQVFRGPVSLELDETGFTYTAPPRVQRIGWRDVSTFRLGGLPRMTRKGTSKYIDFSYRDANALETAKGTDDFPKHSSFVNNFGLSTEELLTVLNRARSEAISG
jgi:hypothetical protein